MKNKLNFKLLTLAMAVVSVAGCSSFPEGFDKGFSPNGSREEQAVRELNDSWAYTPAVTYVKSLSGLTLRKTNFVPEKLASKKITLQFQAGTPVGLSELLPVLREEGVNIVSKMGEVKVNDLYIPRFKGSLGQLLDLLGQLHNFAYEYRNGVIFLMPAARYSVAMPQNKDFMAAIESGLKNMGAENVRPEMAAGVVYFDAKPSEIPQVTEYLEAVGKNAAMVSLQVAVLTVSHNREVNVGFDWATFMAKAGGGDLLNASSAVATAASTVAGTAATAGNAVANAVKHGRAVSFGGDSLGYKFANGNFNLQTAIRALSTYGKARTEQNVVLGTMSGMPVKITSGNDIPYVKSVGSSIASGGAIAGSANTATIQSGLKLEVTPNYDGADASVVTQIKVDMSTLVGFRELPAGTNLGTLSQPEMQKLTFENVGRLTAGETLVIGGITYDQLTNNYQTLPGMENYEIASNAMKRQRQSIYIVVRPTVVVFTPDAELLKNKASKTSDAGGN